VIGPTGAVRVMVATRPVDFRKGAEGLAALVREEMRADPFSGTIYVFRARRADRVKLVYWDGTGVCLFAKRLGGRPVPLAGDRGWRDPADRRAALRTARRARLAPGPRGARDGGAG
jgi:transposase